MRIDAHVHGMDADLGENGKPMPPLRPAWRPGGKSPAEYTRECREKGIEKVLLLDPPEIVFALKDIFGDFVLAAPQVDLDRVTPAEIDGLFRRGACGIKFISPCRSYGDDAYLPVYEAVLANRGLAVFHTGYLGLGLFGPGGLLERASVVKLDDMRPSAIDRVARLLPDLKILMAHFGNPWWEEAWKIMASHRNIYADFSGGTAWRRPMDMWRMIFKPDGKLDAQAVAKLCFASDVSLFFPKGYEAPNQVEFYERFYESLGVPAELRARVDRENILELTAR